MAVVFLPVLQVLFAVFVRPDKKAARRPAW
jgi:hypothetical protein